MTDLYRSLTDLLCPVGAAALGGDARHACPAGDSVEAAHEGSWPPDPASWEFPGHGWAAP